MTKELVNEKIYDLICVNSFTIALNYEMMNVLRVRHTSIHLHLFRISFYS